jgi:signal transduction histidine kinase
MEPLLATTLFTWAAIYAYVGAFYCALHIRRPTHREYLAFGLTCLGLVASSAGAALVALSDGVGEAAMALELQNAGGFMAVALFVDFAMHLAGKRSPRAMGAAYAYCGIGVIACAFGLTVDHEHSTPRPEWGLAWVADRTEPLLSPLGSVLLLGVTVIACWGAAMIFLATRRHVDLRPVAVAAIAAILCGAHDIIARVLNARSVRMSEHVGLLLVLAVSWVLLRRFVRAADELGTRTEELKKSYSSLRVTQEELVRKEQLAAVGELSAVIAHEVRNPLAIIKNAVSSLRRPTLRATDRGVLLGILDEEVDRLNRLVRDLLAYARPVEPRGRAIALPTIIEQAIQTASHGLDGREIDVVLQLDHCPTIHGDPDLLRQAIVNIADNAMQAMPNGGRLVVSAERARIDTAPAVALAFADSGEGMETLVRDKARDPFFTTRAAGTGLGLAIVERVIKNHGGTLSIESEPGKGTTVHIVLPLQRASSVPPPPEET